MLQHPALITNYYVLTPQKTSTWKKIPSPEKTTFVESRQENGQLKEREAETVHDATICGSDSVGHCCVEHATKLIG